MQIFFTSQHMIAVDKPCGLLSVPGIGPAKQDCLITRLQETFPEARIVHRLDRDTSGVMILARDADTHRELSRQFQDREVSKRYIAVVAGHMREDEGEIDLPIRKDMNAGTTPRHIVDHEQGRASLSRYRTLDRCSMETPDGTLDISRIELSPLTGRSHQLRVHLKAIGHPILGDDLYAPPHVLAASDRLLLHATYLYLTDPYTAEPREFVSACPF